MTTRGQTRRAGANLLAVSSDYARLALEIAPGVNPITGRLIEPDGTRTVFAGWAELIRVIERAADVQLDRTEPDDDDDGSNTTRRSS
jgi:hypothetical protein